MTRLAAILGAFAIAAIALGNAAHASSSVISASVAPIVGIGLDSTGNVTPGGSTVDVSVTRERRGNTLVVTVTPNG